LQLILETALRNLKTSLNGTYHAIKHAKYADRYLAEFAYRFNRCFDLAAMVPVYYELRLHKTAIAKPAKDS
jgi:ISXO2-like transposase domain